MIPDRDGQDAAANECGGVRFWRCVPGDFLFVGGILAEGGCFATPWFLLRVLKSLAAVNRPVKIFALCGKFLH